MAVAIDVACDVAEAPLECESLHAATSNPATITPVSTRNTPDGLCTAVKGRWRTSRARADTPAPVVLGT
jgi:hypothetical protein